VDELLDNESVSRRICNDSTLDLFDLLSFHLSPFWNRAECDGFWLQGFEKMISGMYLGDCVRRLLVQIAQETGIFGSCVPHKLLEAFSLHFFCLF
jgi:hypothetical protein